MSIYNTLSQNLILLREKNNYTQQFIAKVIGVNRSAYASYEIGRSMPKLDTLLKLAKVYKVSLDSMLGIDPAIEKTSAKLSSGRAKYDIGYPVDNDMRNLSDFEQYIVLKTRLMDQQNKNKLSGFIEQLDKDD